MADLIIGDTQPKAVQQVVACFPVSVVPVADISDIASDLNAQPEASGKQKGAMILAEGALGVFILYVAGGSDPDSTWAPVDGGTVVTPA